jgi:hypothetical protein
MAMRQRFLVVLAAALPLAAAAQEALRPAQRDEVWLAGAVQGRLPVFLKDKLGSAYKNFRFRSELGYRSTDAFFLGRQAYLDVNLRYRLDKGVAIAVEHRFAKRAATDGLRHRSIVQLELDRSVGRFSLGYRGLWQHSYIAFGGKREVFRNRFELGYDFPKWKLDPEVSVEFFNWARPEGWSYFGTRYRLGTQYRITKAHAIGLDLIHDRERDRAWPTHRWITSVTYTLNLRQL